MDETQNPAVGQSPMQFINEEIAWMIKRDDVKPQLAIVRLLKVELEEFQRNAPHHNEPNQGHFAKILQKQLKKLKDEKAAFESAGRDTTAVDKQIAYVEVLLPDMMSETELRAYIHDYVGDYQDMPAKLNIGAIMASLNLRFEGGFDKGLASQIAKQELAKCPNQ